MKITALCRLRRELAVDAPVFGLWITLESPSITEMAVALGVDWVVIDAEHGHLDWKEVVEHLRATVRSDTVALVRLADLNGSLIKRALDIGADGVVIPWVESVEQLRRAISFARYPPEGLRGIGSERATAWGQCLGEHTTEANANVLVVPIIETVRAAEQVPAMTEVEGAELFFFGPADYSASAGYRGQWEGPGVAEQLLALKDILRRAGKQCGIMGKGDADVQQRLQQGFRAIGLGMDAGLLSRSLHGALAAVGRDRPMRTSFVPTEAAPPPLARPPESMRPDRAEVMNEVAAAPRNEIASGVTFECLVGEHNGARRLTTGIVTFVPEAALPYHTHPFSESITVLRGEVVVEVEGRCYLLAPLDNVVIPRATAHAARNPSAHESAVLHTAMASERPTRALVENLFPRQHMPKAAHGWLGAERLNRFQVAARSPLGPNTEFIDFFNEELLPGVEMSGGYGLFHPGGRLPAHLHDFDESICIIDGLALCVVEGRRYTLQSCATALVPRGRVHYFINESAGPMAMLWVYAGASPERIVVDERCATADGNPWR
jgi:2-dehydro-3-deoxyglucarate aldolase/4-hydroxy-2-oxoheptanedioate aldolase